MFKKTVNIHQPQHAVNSWSPRAGAVEPSTISTGFRPPSVALRTRGRSQGTVLLRFGGSTRVAPPRIEDSYDGLPDQANRMLARALLHAPQSDPLVHPAERELPSCRVVCSGAQIT